MLAHLRNIWLIGMFLATCVEILLNGACHFESTGGQDSVFLSNSAAVSGWTVLSNKTESPIKVANGKNRMYEFIITPFNRRSFNWRGEQRIECFKGNAPISCSSVIDIVKCFPLASQNQGERYRDLQLES